MLARTPASAGPWSCSSRSVASTGASPRRPQTLSAAVAASSTTLTDLHGIGDVLAAKILARSGAVSRFRSASAFASFVMSRP
ncbi:transposase [Micromonospora sp. AMSO31t]|uniref:transposase n=1 Tax=Micromonospora sp. AMSO31t TaxID=2650566 RepID=UPI00351B6B9A